MTRLQLLFQKYLDNQISAEEFTEFWQLLDTEEQPGALTPQLQQLWERQPEYTLTDRQWDRQFQALKNIQSPVSPKKRSYTIVYAAAAVIFLLLCSGYFLFKKSNALAKPGLQTNIVLANDVKAGTDGAILSFDNGKTIIIDSARNGEITGDISKSGEGITVSGMNMEYAALTTPRARQQQLTLSDGSKVWLNAASSIHFPSAFTGKKRVVEITGEAYFEVAKDTRRPFIVKVKDAAIEVLGTHFNVMAYTNEENVQATLLEGSIKFSRGNEWIILKPGQQGRLMPGGKINLVENADTELATAWKNGQQSFYNADIQTIMRQVERWYDVDVSYEGNIPKRTFSGNIPRDANLSALLKLFEVNRIRFRIDGEKKKLVVMP